LYVSFNTFLSLSQEGVVGELADRIHLSVRIKGLRYIKAAFKIAGIKSLSELKGGIDENWTTNRSSLELPEFV